MKGAIFIIIVVLVYYHCRSSTNLAVVRRSLSNCLYDVAAAVDCDRADSRAEDYLKDILIPFIDIHV